MRSLTLLAAFLAATTTCLAAPELRPRDQFIEERHVVELTRRQADLNQLLELASLAGIPTLPANPELLLSLGPLASSLAAQLPTSSVLSVLVTAAPSNFLSSIINDPSFASSFASDFSAGSSPDWFNSLPTGVKSYLHTYDGFTGVASAVAGAETGGVLSGLASAAGSESGSASEGSSGENGSTESTSGGGTSTEGASASGSVSGSGTAAGSQTTAAGSSSASGADTASSSQAGQGGNEENTVSSSPSGGAASRPTGVVAAGMLGVVGVIGLVGL